jgi:hypothetical protein
MKTIWLLIFAFAFFLFGCKDSSKESDTSSVDNLSVEEFRKDESPSVAANGGTNAYNYEFTDATADASLIGIASGAYTVVTDVNGNSTSGVAPAKTPDKIIKTGYLEMEVDNYAKTLSDLAQRVQVAQGYISSQDEQRNNYRISNTLSIRVVNQNFDSLINGLGDMAKKVVSKSVNMQDVSEEYTDVAARLKSKKEVAARYSDILKSAKTIKDILAVEEQLRIIREEIESSEARLKFLDDRVSYSTITLQLYDELEYNAPAPLQAGFGQKLVAAVIGGWNGLLALSIGLVSVWPLLLIMGAIIVVVIRKVRRRRVVA